MTWEFSIFWQEFQVFPMFFQYAVCPAKIKSWNLSPNPGLPLSTTHGPEKVWVWSRNATTILGSARFLHPSRTWDWVSQFVILRYPHDKINISKRYTIDIPVTQYQSPFFFDFFRPYMQYPSKIRVLFAVPSCIRGTAHPEKSPRQKPLTLKDGRIKQGLLNGTHFSVVIIIPILGGIKQYKSMVIFRDFPYDNALFGLVYFMTPVLQGMISSSKSM